MTNKTFIYKGPPSSCSLRIGEKIVDVILHPGREVSLPAEHEYTQSMIAQNRLIPVISTMSTSSPGKAVKVKSPAIETQSVKEDN